MSDASTQLQSQIMAARKAEFIYYKGIETAQQAGLVPNSPEFQQAVKEEIDRLIKVMTE